MNYYIQGSPARAKEIKAAFEAKGCVMHTGIQCDLNDMIYFSLNGKVGSMKLRNLDLFKTHPDYKELELPVEPKFKVGDWVERGKGFVYEPSLITEIRDYYICELLNGERVTYTLSDVHKNFHLWTIADAKDGDVLSTNSIICIFKKLDKDGYYIISPCIYTVKGGLEVIDDENDSIGSYGFKPATKEDRELLFRKIKEAGYEWDADKKELRKIKSHYDISNFNPFDKVLVRCSNDEEWMIEFYCKYDTLVHTSPHRDYPFMGIGDSYSQCIPYNDDTKHLLGTTDMCPEEYINW